MKILTTVLVLSFYWATYVECFSFGPKLLLKKNDPAKFCKWAPPASVTRTSRVGREKSSPTKLLNMGLFDMFQNGALIRLDT